MHIDVFCFCIFMCHSCYDNNGRSIYLCYLVSTTHILTPRPIYTKFDLLPCLFSVSSFFFSLMVTIIMWIRQDAHHFISIFPSTSTDDNILDPYNIQHFLFIHQFLDVTKKKFIAWLISRSIECCTHLMILSVSQWHNKKCYLDYLLCFLFQNELTTFKTKRLKETILFSYFLFCTSFLISSD